VQIFSKILTKSSQVCSHIRELTRTICKKKKVIYGESLSEAEGNTE
jgi:hypothetical protein